MEELTIRWNRAKPNRITGVRKGQFSIRFYIHSSENWIYADTVWQGIELAIEAKIKDMNSINPNTIHCQYCDILTTTNMCNMCREEMIRGANMIRDREDLCIECETRRPMKGRIICRKCQYDAILPVSHSNR